MKYKKLAGANDFLRQVKLGLKLLARAQARADAAFKLIDQKCDCAGFKKGNGIWFDSEDLYEGRYTKCPACKKPFSKITIKKPVTRKRKR